MCSAFYAGPARSGRQGSRLRKLFKKIFGAMLPALSFGLVVLGSICAAARGATVLAQAPVLAPDCPISGAVTAEETVLALDLDAGQFARIAVEQQQVDLVIELRSPGGETLAERDSLISVTAVEELSWVAASGGRHLVVLRRADAGQGAGGFTARLVTRRRATEEDRRWARAEALGYEALCLAVGRDPHGEALAGFRQAAELWRGLRAEAPARTLAGTLYRLADVYRQRREPEAAAELLGDSIGLWQWIGDPGEEGRTRNRLGRVLYERGDSLDALASWERALELRRAAGDRSGEARTLTNLGALRNSFGEAQQALDAYRAAPALWDRPGGDDRDRAATLNNLGVLYRNLGDYPSARRYYERALELDRRHREREREARTLNNLGWVDHLAGELERARARYAESLELSRELADRSLEAAVRTGLGRLLTETGEPAAARQHLERAVALRREEENPRGLAAALQSLGELERRQGRLAAASAALAEGLALAERLGDRQLGASLAIRLARVEGERGRPDRALALGRRALERVEAVRGEVIRPDLRASFTASRRAYYEIHLGMLYDAHRAEPAAGHAAEAFEIAERAHARTLLETLAAAHVDLRRGVDSALVERETALERQLNGADRRRQELLLRGAPPATTAALDERIAGWIEALRELAAEIRRRSPLYASLTRPQPLPLDELRRQLDGGELVLEFVLGEERSFLLALSCERLELFPLPPRRLLEATARDLIGTLTARGRRVAGHERVAADRRARRLARELSDALLGPVAGWLGEQRLIVVPDGGLHYVPFAALPVPGSDEPGSRTAWFDTPLIARHELTHQPSISTVALLREVWRQRPAPAPTLAVWADPVFDADDPRLAGSGVAEIVRQGPAVAAEGTRSPDLRVGLARLPYSAGEATAIAALRPASRTFVGLDAQPETLGDAQRYGVLHFATHGVIDSEHPELSRLALSMFDAGGQPRDGFLRLHDVYDLELNAELVVLSACRTALGKEIRGEGLVSLIRGFLHAGARRVVASQWDVDDRATARLMEAFYRAYMEQGRRPAAALCRAQLELARRRGTAAPYFWAGFLMQGEWR